MTFPSGSRTYAVPSEIGRGMNFHTAGIDRTGVNGVEVVDAELAKLNEHGLRPLRAFGFEEP